MEGQVEHDKYGKSLNYDDPSSSGKIWSIYVAEAEKYDKALTRGWTDDMDGTLIFAGLFSASVTAFLIEGLKTLKPDSGDVTVAILTQISKQLAGTSNSTQSSFALPSGSVDPVPNHQMSHPVLVNVLWLLSLSLSLGSALTATLVKQWVRNYLHSIERRPASAPHRRARIRSFLHEGLENFHMRVVVDAIPTLLHASLFLFFAGLFEFLRPVNPTMAYLALGILVISAGMYLVIAYLPTLYRNCPYRTPLSIAWWYLRSVMRVIRLVFSTSLRRGRLQHLTWRKVVNVFAIDTNSTKLTQSLEDTAMRSSPVRKSRDYRALRWMIDSLTDDNELEPFVAGISEFVSTEDGMSLLFKLLNDTSLCLGRRITKLLQTCVHGQGLPPVQRQRRAEACLSAMWPIMNNITDLQLHHSIFDAGPVLAALQELSKDREYTLATYATCMKADLLCKLLTAATQPHSNIAGWTEGMPWLMHMCGTYSGSSTVSLWKAQLESLLEAISGLPSDSDMSHRYEFPDVVLKVLSNARLLGLCGLVTELTKAMIIPEEASTSLRFIMINMTTQLRADPPDPTIQALFVRAMESVEDRLGSGLPIEMIEELLPIFGVLDDSSSLEKAIRIVIRYMEENPHSAAVKSLGTLASS